MKEIALIENQYLKKEVPEFSPGDFIRVSYRIEEGGKTRLQKFDGIVIKIRGEGLKKTFTVRKESQGVGVERIFPLHSPNIAKIQVLRKGDVRRAKLYYLREKKGKEKQVKEKKAKPQSK
jgi:large subunit ribosomal protein L19|uniref:Large ribosomal subunit protein bL19 n=1 Tax=candidate division WOR-3 bacterium TaxID=2052148 RepID=A0A7C4YBR7_UNCW3